jgi:hypothetical protein
MLLDRVCLRGGWNAGNSAVFGVELDPQPDFTAMAVLALRDSVYNQEIIVRRSLDYLAARFSEPFAPYSLAWALIALSAYSHEAVSRLRAQLEASIVLRLDTLPARTLAVAALALEQSSFSLREDAL